MALHDGFPTYYFALDEAKATPCRRGAPSAFASSSATSETTELLGRDHGERVSLLDRRHGSLVVALVSLLHSARRVW